jgi:hypothetical protein
VFRRPNGQFLAENLGVVTNIDREAGMEQEVGGSGCRRIRRGVETEMERFISTLLDEAG